MRVYKILAWVLILILVFSSLVYASPTAQQVSLPTSVVVQRQANLRAGPGTTYAIAGRANQGDTLQVIACNPACDWYQVQDGAWIAAFLVKPVAPQSAAGEQQITVVGWNTELNDADVQVIADRMATFQEVDLWGLSEVNQSGNTPILEAGAEDGENADYTSILSVSGGGDRLLALYDTTRFDLLDSWELEAINTTGNARAPLVLHLREKARGTELLFMVNHLYRSRDEERYKQAQLLQEWAAQQTLPVIAVGDYNFDWDVVSGSHDRGYDLMTKDSEFTWVKPTTLVTTQCSGWPCQFDSVLDFVFVAGPAQSWRASSQIIVTAGDCPDDNRTSDHRPVMAQFWPATGVTASPTITPTPTAMSALSPAIAMSNANLRSGPGTGYAVAGRVQQGENLALVGKNQNGDWYQLRGGAWITAVLVDNAPTSLPIAELVPLPTPVTVPPTPTSVAAATSTPAPTQPAASSGVAQVVIQNIVYDGQVASVESDEYAVIANIGTTPINLGGWRLNAGADGQDFRFPAFDLAPGQSIRVYTNEHHPDSGGFSFGSGKALWNNKGDCGLLFDASNNKVAEWCY